MTRRRNEPELPRACLRAREEWTSCRADDGRGGYGRPRSFKEIVSAYIRNHRRGANAEVAYYAHLPTVKSAVLRAARAERPDGKRADHQRRLTGKALREVERRLASLSFSRIRTFQDLIALLEDTIGDVPGIGELMVYDTALRIGARLGLEPELVYLHAGTMKGARALGLLTGQGYVMPNQLPATFRRLSPREIEDCLCIFKDDLAAVAR